jgi:small subunit ribosomal protein S1
MTPLPVVPEELGRPEAPALGSVFRGRVGVTSESGHIALVNRLVDRAAIVAELEQARVNRRRVEGMVFGFNRGGFDVLVAGMRAFCPASAMSLMEIEDPNELVGKKLEFLLPAAQPVGSDIIVSRRSILERQQRKAAREMLKGLTPGQKFTGIVHSVREFGLIVDIGGIEGLVHQSELSWAHGVRPQDVAKPGDTVEVQVLRIGAEGGRDQGPQRRDRMTRVGLSIKALLPDPWDAHNDVLHEGGVQKGKVTRTTDFGAFIQLAPEIEGLLHITELGRDLKHASQAVNEGDEIHVVVERVDRRARRIALSKLTAAEVAEFEAGALEAGQKAVRPGTRITVKVEKVDPRGLLVRVQGAVGRRARGYVPRSEMGEAGSGDMRKRYPQGSSLDVKVVGIDRDGGIRCSPKALQVDDERKAIKDYRREAAQQGFGTFGDLLRAKLGEAGPK